VITLIEQQIRRISTEELKERMKRKEPFILADARPLSYFGESHIPGAIPIPADEVTELAGSFDRDIDIITYCGGYDCPASTIAAKKFIDMGFKNVYDYKGGIKEWMDEGNPAENNI
jgi:rhodanese-related sulfurtransferase